MHWYTCSTVFAQFPMELDTIPNDVITFTSCEEEDTLMVGTRGHHVMKWREAVCIAGGYTELTDYQYCPQLYYPSQTNHWPSAKKCNRLLPPCPTKWFSTVVIEDKLVTVGGVDRKTGQPTNKLYHWNDFLQQWEESYYPMITPRLFATSVLYHSYLIVMGGAYDVHATDFGDVVEVLDITSKQWYRAEKLPAASGNKQGVIINDTLFLLSGWLQKWKDPSAWCCNLPQLLESINDIEFSASKKSKLSTVWKTMNSPLPSSAITTVGNCLLAVGGWEALDDKPSDIVQYYHQDRMIWQNIGNLKQPRAAGAAIACSDEKVLVFGGRVGASLYSNTIECITLTI